MQTFHLTEKIEIEGKTCQNTENKQTFELELSEYLDCRQKGFL